MTQAYIYSRSLTFVIFVQFPDLLFSHFMEQFFNHIYFGTCLPIFTLALTFLNNGKVHTTNQDYFLMIPEVSDVAAVPMPTCDIFNFCNAIMTQMNVRFLSLLALVTFFFWYDLHYTCLLFEDLAGFHCVIASLSVM